MHRLTQSRFAVLLLALLLTLGGLTACNEHTFISTSYKTLSLSADTYDARMKCAADLDHAGKLTPEAKQRIIEIGHDFQAAHQLASSALEAYAATTGAEDKAKLVTALAEVTRVMGELTAIIRPFLGPTPPTV